MKQNSYIFLIIFVLYSFLSLGYGQTKQQSNMNKNNLKKNPLLCDTESGVCTTSAQTKEEKAFIKEKAQNKNIKILYFTDPICSSCWGIEPQLRKLKLAYGKYIDIEYRMGGLLPDWNYNSGGISQPKDVAVHWDEASKYYDMPIDGDLWIEDPLMSSYPPSIAFKAAEMQDKKKATLFLRTLREMVFMQKKNIAKWEEIVRASELVGMDSKQLEMDFKDKAKRLFQEDLELAKSYGVRGFPTVFFIDNKGNTELIYGSRPYPFYEVALLKLLPTAKKKEYKKNWETLFSYYKTLTAKEFSELSDMPRQESEEYLNQLTEQGKLIKQTCKNGAIWHIKQ